MNPFHLQNIERFNRLEKGQEKTDGMLTQQSAILTTLVEGHAEIKEGLAQVGIKTTTYNKQKVWNFLKWLLGGVGALGATLLSMYIAHAKGWIH